MRSTKPAIASLVVSLINPLTLKPFRLCAFATIAASLLLTSCSSPKTGALYNIIDRPLQAIRPSPPITDIRNADDSLAYRQVEEFFITDRGLDSTDKSALDFNANRGEPTYGRALVTIPPTHIKGQLESNSLLPDSQKSAVMLKQPLRKESKEQFFAKLNERIAASTDKSLLLFVHGYNNTFADSAKVLGQITHDVEISGTTVLFSWPSQGSLSGYFEDTLTLDWAQHHLEQALIDILKQAKTNKIYLMAHSMGTEALSRAILNLKPELTANIKEIILLAPDIDTDVFKEELAPKLVATGKPITVYVSNHDMGLKSSKKIHQYPRAGDASLGPLITPGVQTIDVSLVDASLLGHSYFSESREIMSDLYYLIKFGQSASQRFGLQAIDTPEGRYWRLVR